MNGKRTGPTLDGGMTLRAYARSRKISPAAVHKAIASGRIRRRPDGLIDPVEADELWERNTRPRIDGAGKADGGRTAASLLAERTRRERAEAGLAEIELAKASGSVIEVEVAARLWESAIARVRAKMLAAVSSHAPRFVGVKTVAESSAVLEDVVYSALAEAASVAEEVARGDCG